MATVTVPAYAVKVGQTVIAHGIRWIVRESFFQRDAEQPRRVLVCDAHPEDVEQAGAFATGLHLGMLNDEPTALVV